MTRQDGLSPSLVESIAGFTAGIVSTLSLHPLDLIKTRLQVDTTSSNRLGSSIRVIREIAQNEGGLVAFYRGLTPNLIGNSSSWAVYFLCYGNVKDVMRRVRSHSASHPGSKGELSSGDYFLASGGAGILTAILTNPIWVLKTRMLSTGSQTPGAYPSFISGSIRIYRTEGIPGFYRGLVPSLFGVSHGALQFMAYEKLKEYRRGQHIGLSHGQTQGRGEERRQGEERLGNIDLFIISSLSKIFAGSITYPYQVLRSRLQTYDAHVVYSGGARDAIRRILGREGMIGFWKGFGPNLVRVLPSTWVTFLVYENMRVYLPVWFG